jgi:hypothetical protein
MSFLLYISFFLYARVFDGYTFVACICGTRATCRLCTNRRRPRPEAVAAVVGGEIVVGNLPIGEAERVLRLVDKNFTTLTRTFLMEEIEDLPPSMQPHVVGAPRTWVQLFRCLVHAVDYFNRAHRP